MDFAKNVGIESYSETYFSGRLIGDGASRRRYHDLIAKQAARTNEQYATAQELMLKLEIA